MEHFIWNPVPCQRGMLNNFPLIRGIEGVAFDAGSGKFVTFRDNDDPGFFIDKKPFLVLNHNQFLCWEEPQHLYR